ncbi:hypothetical protein BC938DRAFT_473001 [Jimgerdemannia flammicorona]|uniref:F-box domain-containing protein n=1 Tax=Jimgerdemannia flammicorona TaxID=994334 RepID=A0A433Q4Y5_9FUNG|nr:hypothetical protein BC938DRAFT_473001 [Jimgerdemannia flammicorona]
MKTDRVTICDKPPCTILSSARDTVLHVNMELSNFPPELISRVFTFLSNKEDAIRHHIGYTALYACSLVCHDWRATALPMIWSKLNLQSTSQKIRIHERLSRSLTESRSHAATENHADRANHIVMIDLSADMYALEEHWSEVTAPVFHILRLFSPDQLHTVNLHFPHFYFTPLQWRVDPNASSGLPSTLFPALTRNLKHLSVSCLCSSCTDSDAILQNLPDRLEALHLTGSSDSPWYKSATSLDRILSLSKLRNLHACDLRLTVSHLERGLRSWGPRLQHLRITDRIDPLEDALVRALTAHCPSLQSLGLQVDLGDSEPLQVSNDALVALFGSCASLERLVLRGCSAMSNGLLAVCASQGRGLRVLEIDDPFGRLTGEGVVDLSGWVRLEKFIVEDSVWSGERIDMDEAFVLAVKTKCHALTKCKLRGVVVAEQLQSDDEL